VKCEVKKRSEESKDRTEGDCEVFYRQKNPKKENMERQQK
jgi:hypothetical protein